MTDEDEQTTVESERETVGDENPTFRSTEEISEGFLTNNREQRETWRTEFTDKATEIKTELEEGKQNETDGISGIVNQAINVARNNQLFQDNLEKKANQFRNQARSAKANYETQFEEREGRVGIDWEDVEGSYSDFRTSLDEARMELLPMALERERFRQQNKNEDRQNDATRANEGPSVEAQRQMEESWDLWRFAEDEGQENKNQAEEAINSVLEGVNLEGQKLELRDRIEEYEAAKDTVDSALDTIRNADDEIDSEQIEEDVKDTVEALDLDVNYDDIEGDELADIARNAQEEIARSIDAEDQLESNPETEIENFYDQEDVGPVEAAKLLKTTVVDAAARQAERYEEALDTVTEVRTDLEQIKSGYENLEDTVEDLTTVTGVREAVADELEDAGIYNIFDLAEASTRKLNRKTDLSNTRGENAESLVEAAQVYIETELAPELELADPVEQMEESFNMVGDDYSQQRSDIRRVVREQVKTAYDSKDTAVRYLNSLLEEVPGEDEAEIGSLEIDGETIEDPTAYLDNQREDIYEDELGMEETQEPGEIGFLEDSNDVNLEYDGE